MGSLFAINMVTTASALLYISYPVQVIGRNIRLLFVVLIGAFFSRVKKDHKHLKLGKHKIFIAIIITIGVLLFNFAKDTKDKGDKHDKRMRQGLVWRRIGHRRRPKGRAQLTGCMGENGGNK